MYKNKLCQGVTSGSEVAPTAPTDGGEAAGSSGSCLALEKAPWTARDGGLGGGTNGGGIVS